MSNFHDWFKKAYKRWSRSQPGEEDFLAFCDLLGCSPATVLSWLHGDSVPQGAEVLSVASVLGLTVYKILGQPEPDPEFMKIYNSFSHLNGEFRSKLAQALWEAQTEINCKGFTYHSEEAKLILSKVFKKWKFEK